MKRASWLIATLVVILVLALPVVLLLAAPMIYLPLMERAVRSATGFELALEDASVSLFPLKISLSGLQLSNPDFDAPLLTARHLSATAWLGDYFQEAPTWWRGSASGVDVRLEQDGYGNSNWQLPGQDQPRSATGPGRTLDFSVLELSDLSVVRVGARLHEVEISSARLEQAEDERVIVDLQGRYEDEPLEASGTLALPSSDRAREVDLQARMFGGSLSVDGRVGYDGIAPGRAKVVARFDDLGALGMLLNEDLSFLEPIRLNGDLTAPEQGRWQLDVEGQIAGKRVQIESHLLAAAPQYRLEHLALGFGESSLTATGSVDLAQRQLEGDVNAARIVVEELMLLAGPEQTTAGATGDRHPERRIPQIVGEWSYDLALHVDELRYPASRLEGLDLSLADQPQAIEFSAGLERAWIDTADNGWQLVEPLSADGRLRFAGEDLLIATGLDLELAAAGVAGRVDADWSAADDEQQRVRLQAKLESLAAIENVGVSKSVYDDLLPIDVDLEAGGSGSQWHVTLSGAGVAGTEVDGDLEIDAAAQPIAVRGRLHAPEIDLNTIPTTSGWSGEDEQSPEETAAVGPEGLIPDEPIDWSWLDLASVDVEAHVERLLFNQTNFRNVRTRVVLEEGQLNVEPISAGLTQGGVRGHTRIARRDDGAEVDLRLVVSQLVPADLGQPHQGLIDGGATDLVVELTAGGGSWQGLANTLSGELVLEIQRATVRNNLLDKVASDVVVQTLTMINPFVERDDQTELQCAAADLVAESGEITSRNRIVIETSKVVVRAGGTVDLQDETLTLDFIPSPREGLGISLGGLADLVRLKGPLSSPKPEVNPAGVLKSGAKVAAAIATGGASLLAQGLFSRARNLGTACGSIFEEQTDIPRELEVEEGVDG